MARSGPGSCQCCRSPRRAEIDLALVYGDSQANIAQRFAVSADAVQRHSARHLSASQRAALLSATRPSEIDVEALTKREAQGLLSNLIAQRVRLQSHAMACAAAGDAKGAIAAERVVLANYETTGRLVGTLINRTEISHAQLTLHPQYIKLRQALIAVLAEHPEVRMKVAAALMAIESDEAAEITSRTPALIEAKAEPAQ